MRSLAAALAEKISSCEVNLDAQAVGNGLFGKLSHLISSHLIPMKISALNMEKHNERHSFHSHVETMIHAFVFLSISLCPNCDNVKFVDFQVCSA